MRYVLVLVIVPLMAFASINFNEYNVNAGLQASYHLLEDGTWAGWDSTVTTWDFSGFTGGETASVNVVNPSGQPGSGDFPEADYCEQLTIPGIDMVYAYFSAVGSGMSGDVEQYGAFTTFEGFDALCDFSSPRTVFRFPMHIGTAWTADYEWEVSIWPFSWDFHETHDCLVVGEGIVKVPASGDDWWECMVIRDYFTHWDDTKGSEARWFYTWVVADGFAGAGFPNGNGVFTIASQDGGGPDFTSYDQVLSLSTTTANPDPWTAIEQSTWGSIKANW